MLRKALQASWILLGCSLGAQESVSQEELEMIREFKSIINTKVNLASRLTQSQEEAPSAVSVVTRADILRYGWQDLKDILRALPGFDFGQDGTGLIGLSERGIWGHEGKILLMVNGLTISPLHNGNVNYYGYLPSELIERVEVIRGPGSAIYGQFAGAAVINIITRTIEDGDGGRFSLRASSLGGGDQGGGGYMTAGGQLSGGVFVSLSAGFQTSPFSRQPYQDTFFTGQSFGQEKGNSRRETSYISGEVQALGTRVQLLRTTFKAAQVDGDGSGPRDPVPPELAPGTVGTGSRVIQALKASRTFSLRESLALEAFLEEIENTGGSIYPASGFSGGVNHSGTERSRFTGDLALRWTPTLPTVLLVGGGISRNQERSVDLNNQGGLRDPNDPTHLLAQKSLATRYGYVQYTQQINQFGLTAGARYEDSEIGHAFAPRLGVTWVKGPFNAKLLYGEAFRAPTLFQTYSTIFSFKGFLKPEQIRSTELELGYRFTPWIVGRLNLFKMSVTQEISFGLDNTGIYYVNAGATHSVGLEASLEVRQAGWGGFANFSYAKPEGTGDPFFLSGDRNQFLGLSPMKLNLGAYFLVGPVRVSPTLMYGSARETQTARSAQSGITPPSLLPNIIESESVPGRVLVNVSLGWKGLVGPTSDTRLTIQNVTNAKVPILQPYYGFHAPLPANDRLVSLDLQWRF